MRGQLTPQRAAGLHIQRLVDRLGGHPHLRLVREVGAEPARDLFRGVLLPQILLHPLPQHDIDPQLCRLRPAGPLIGRGVRSAGPVAALPVTVACHLPRDRRHTPAQSRRDLAHRLTPSPARSPPAHQIPDNGPADHDPGAGAPRRPPAATPNPDAGGSAPPPPHQSKTHRPAAPPKTVAPAPRPACSRTGSSSTPSQNPQVLQPPREPGGPLAGQVKYSSSVTSST